MIRTHVLPCRPKAPSAQGDFCTKKKTFDPANVLLYFPYPPKYSYDAGSVSQ